MKFHMFMLMNAWMMLVLIKCKCQMQCLTLGCYTTPPRKRIKHSKESHEPKEHYKQDTYLNQKLITREISEASSIRTWIHQGTSCRENTDRPAPPPNSSITLYLTISNHRTKSYEGLIFSWLLALILMRRIWIVAQHFWIQDCPTGGGIGPYI